MRARRTTLFKTEAELAAGAIVWLRDSGWEVYQEVEGPSGRCDIVAVRGPLVWAIETKLSFGQAVIAQAQSHLHYAHLVSVATPGARRGILDDYCRWKGIGWLVVGWPGDHPENVREKIAPELHRRIIGDLRQRLREEHKTMCPAGSARGGHFTPFKDTCRKVAELVREQPGIALKDLLDLVPTHYTSKASARAGIAHWTKEGKVPGVRLERDGKGLRLYPATTT